MLDVLCRHLPMVRLRITLAAAMALAVAACTGDIIDPEGDPLEAAIQAFDTNVSPTLAAKCAACHVSTENPQFMKPNPTLREGVLTFNSGGLVDLMNPVASRLAVFASSQAHAQVGVNFTPAEAAKVTAWVELEALAGGVVAEPVVETQKITPMLGANEIDLTEIGLAGSKFKFDYQPLATGMYLSRITVDASTGGVRLVHPLFVVWDAATPIPDPIDRFSDIDLTVAELTSSQVGGGTAVFVDIPPSGQLSVHFKTATFANGMPPSDGGGIVGGGCKAVALFTSNVRPPLQGNCTSCHAGANTGATGATDMRDLGDDAKQAEACAQILSRVSKLNPDQSSILESVRPGSTVTHPFKFPTQAAFDTYRTSALAWINAEAAP
jgi:cytochrome c553